MVCEKGYRSNQKSLRWAARRGGNVLLQKSAKSKSPSFVSFFFLDICHSPSYVHPPQPQKTSTSVTMPKGPTLPQSPIKTRSKNKNTHPGIPDQAPPRRSSVEVENERVEKTRAQEVQKEEWKQKIRRAAEFQYIDKANEEIADATPRPSVASKPWPPPRNRKQAKLAPVAEANGDSDDDGDIDNVSFKPPCSEKSATEEESAAESDPRPPTKRLKAQPTKEDSEIPEEGHPTPAKKEVESLPSCTRNGASPG